MNWDVTSANRILRAPLPYETSGQGIPLVNPKNPESIWTVGKTDTKTEDNNNNLEEIQNYVDSQSDALFDKYIANGKLEKSLDLQQTLSSSSVTNIGAIGERINNSVQINGNMMKSLWVKETAKASSAQNISEAKSILGELENKLRELDQKNEAFLTQAESIVNINQDINSLDDQTKEKLNTNLSNYISTDEDEALDPNVITDAISTINYSVENNNQNTMNPFATDTSDNPFLQNKKNPFST